MSLNFEHVLQLPFSQSFIIDFVNNYFNCCISGKTHKLLHLLQRYKATFRKTNKANVDLRKFYLGSFNDSSLKRKR